MQMGSMDFGRFLAMESHISRDSKNPCKKSTATGYAQVHGTICHERIVSCLRFITCGVRILLTAHIRTDSYDGRRGFRLRAGFLCVAYSCMLHITLETMPNPCRFAYGIEIDYDYDFRVLGMRTSAADA